MSKKDDSPDPEWMYTFESAKHGESGFRKCIIVRGRCHDHSQAKDEARRKWII